MPVRATVLFDTSKNSKSLSSYSATFSGASVDEVKGKIEQRAPVIDGHAEYSGAFASRSEAVRAVLTYITAPCRVKELAPSPYSLDQPAAKEIALRPINCDREGATLGVRDAAGNVQVFI
ncbi:hypothetical protein M5E06_17800 [Azospirillum sp. A1-3]|uniref:hypothetical protein n=1 Tax=Azospirillum sp. A1-3 TaxID=185874 RepID=UPI00207707FD|nr:hypothetical protein [Azospirillum sp. A1-3]MCM8735990.1 hypothetical protein [Azospirillum sp. A1-3]